MTLLEDMPHTVKLERRRYERDELGGNVEVLVSISTGVDAWIQNAAARDVTEFQKPDQSVSHRVYFTANPGARIGDVITATAGPSMVGVELEVRAIPPDRSAGLGALFMILCEAANNDRHASFS